MIKGFNAGNTLAQMRLMLPDVRHELGFGIRRARDQYRSSLGDSLSNALEELVVDGRVAAVPGIGFVMDMLVRVGTANGRVVDIRSAELKHLGLAMINPYDGMIMVTHGAELEALHALRAGLARSRLHVGARGVPLGSAQQFLASIRVVLAA
jgi:hypothetical protein